MRDFDQVKWKTWQFGRKMRREPTVAEKLLWHKIRARQLGVKFRRQHALVDFIVDFVSLARMLIIEIDGPTHAEPEQIAYDARRSESLESKGFRLVRFTNQQVKESMEYVLDTILEKLEAK